MSNYQHEVPPPQRNMPMQYKDGEALTASLGGRRQVTVDVREFVRTRDALTSSYMNLSQAIDNAVKAYLNHTQTIINGDGALNATLLIDPFNQITNTAQHVAQQALSAQSNGSIDPQLLQHGQNAQGGQNDEGDGKKKRTKRAYKQRDPNAPKRPLTAYFRFLGEQRPIIMGEVKANPQKFEEAGKPGDISRIATKRWNELGEEAQKPYKDAYKKDLKGYDEAVEKYKKEHGIDVDDSKIDANAHEDPEHGEEEEDATAGGQEKAAEGSDDESESRKSSSSSGESDAEGESDDEVTKKPAASKPAKKSDPTPSKSAMKKGGKQAQTFSSIPSPPAPTPAKEASPSKKRKAAAEPETSKKDKKKSRKSTVTAGADPVPSPAPAAAPEKSSSPAAEKSSKKSKKDKKKRRSSVEA